MEFSPRINRFVEEKLNIRNYSAKVVVLLAVITLLSMVVAFSIDVFLSSKEVKREVETAAKRAAKFRMSAVRSFVLEIFRTDLALIRMIERGKDISPLVGTYLLCVRGGGISVGSVEEDKLKEALEASEGKRLYFHLFTESWTGVSVIREGNEVYLFCHHTPYLKSILSPNLGAIAKYGAQFYLGEAPTLSDGDILVIYKSEFTNAHMFVLVPNSSILKVLLRDRIMVYARLYFVLILLMSVSYILWVKLINYPIRRLKEVVGELEKGNYSVSFQDLLEAKDEFGGIAKLLKKFSEDTKQRLEKLELILDTAIRTVKAPEDLYPFIESTLSQINKMFGSKASLLLLEDLRSGRFTYIIPSDGTHEEVVERMVEIYKKERTNTPIQFEEPLCIKREGKSGCISVAMFRIDDNTIGGVVLLIENRLDPINESYLKVVCQHMFNTVRLTHLATTDPLTGVANRRMLERDIGNYGRLAKRYNKPLSLIMLDIDNFKGINDTYGHAVGDQVLKWIACLIEGTVRDSDSVYRYGGEEFAVLCPETDKMGAYELSERIRKRIREEEFNIDGGMSLYLTVSCGVANYPADTDDPQDLLTVADIALYKAKNEGKDKTVMLLGRDDKNFFVQRFHRGKDFKEAVLKGKTLHKLQPIYDLKTDQIFGYELLLRVLLNGKIKPISEFIDYIDELGLTEEIDRLTVRRVKKLLLVRNMQDKNFFINVSPRSIERGWLFSELESIPLHHRPRVFVEITEREAFLNMREAYLYVERLKGMGFKVVIDDFGSGFSSIFQMRHLVKHIDLIKIDGTFIRNIHKDPYNRAIVESIKTMTDKFSINLVAEFIERVEELETVREIGLRFGQGYLFGEGEEIIT